MQSSPLITTYATKYRGISMSDPKPLDALSDWIERAQQEAALCVYHETLMAVRRTPMNEAEADAAMQLYQEHRGMIEGIARTEYTKRLGHIDEPVVGVDDVVQESYILMLRALVTYTGGPLCRHLRRAIRQRVRGYLDSQLDTVSPSPDTRPDVDQSSTAGRSTEMPQVSIHRLVDAMVAGGELADTDEEAERLRALWARLT